MKSKFTIFLVVVPLTSHLATAADIRYMDSGDWLTAANWQGGVKPGIADVARGNWGNNTVTVTTTESVGAIQWGVDESSTLRIQTGGNLTVLGNGTSCQGLGGTNTSAVIVEGGQMTINSDYYMSLGGSPYTASLEITSGLMDVNGTLQHVSNTTPSTTTTISGTGVLEVNRFLLSNANNSLIFDGGTLRAGASNSDWLGGNGLGVVAIKSNGATIDTGAFDVVVSLALTEDGASPGGGLTKTGSGNLTFHSGVPNGPIVSGLQNLVVNGGTVSADGWAQWNSNLNLTVNGTGVFDIWNTTTSIGNLSGNGTVQNSANWTTYAAAGYATNSLTIAAGNFSGTIKDFGFGTGSTSSGTPGVANSVMSLTKSGAGTLTLSGTNTYSGATTVSAGSLIVNGSISTSVTTVSSGATLGGDGTVGALTINSGAFVTPGNSPGILTVDGNYTQAGQYTAEIAGTTAGSGYDQIGVTGSVNITGGSLVTLFSGAGYNPGDLLFILLNDGSEAITGTYAGFAQGATVASYGGLDWKISYSANGNNVGSPSFTGGNDIALMAIPEPRAALLGAIGMLALLRRRRA